MGQWSVISIAVVLAGVTLGGLLQLKAAERGVGARGFFVGAFAATALVALGALWAAVAANPSGLAAGVVTTTLCASPGIGALIAGVIQRTRAR